MAKKSRSKADTEFIDTLKMIYDYNYIKLHNWRKNEYNHKKLKMILMKNVVNGPVSTSYNSYDERYILANEDYSIYYNDIIWYKSTQDAIYIKTVLEINDDKSKIEFSRINPTDLSVVYSFRSDTVDLILESCRLMEFENIKVIYSIEAVCDTDNSEIFNINFYTVNGTLIKSIKELKNNSRTRRYMSNSELNDIINGIRSVSDTKLVIKDEAFEFDLNTNEIVSKSNWNLDAICKIYDIGIKKESLKKFENNETSKLTFNFSHISFGFGNECTKKACVMFNSYTGNLYISRDSHTFYKINYEQLPYISGGRIIEILEFIGSETALSLVKILKNLPENIRDLGSSLDVIKIGKNPLDNLYSDAKILNKTGTQINYKYLSSGYSTVYNDLIHSIKYFIKDRKDDVFNCSIDFDYDVKVVDYKDFEDDIDNGFKLREKRMQIDKSLEILEEFTDSQQ